MRRLAFLTMDDLDAFIAYDHLAKEPLAERGWHVTDVAWRSGADWDTFDAVILRTPWDYHHDPEAFLAVLETIEGSRARLANPLGVVRWNLRKTYLRELEAHGVPVVPTVWGHGLSADSLADARRRLGNALVIKPTIGAGADDTFRLGTEAGTPADARALAAFADRPYMAQPFIQSVVDWGEASLFYFGGSYSHAIQKTPASGDFRVQEEFGSHLQTIEPDSALREATDRALETAVALTGSTFLYARPDLVRLADGTWALMELELVEPSLYFPLAPGSAARFADAFVRWMEEDAEVQSA
ncbi:MAG: hypothetical protein AAGI52_12890 [Bacteroidota bacterium]